MHGALSRNVATTAKTQAGDLLGIEPVDYFGRSGDTAESNRAPSAATINAIDG